MAKRTEKQRAASRANAQKARAAAAAKRAAEVERAATVTTSAYDQVRAELAAAQAVAIAGDTIAAAAKLQAVFLELAQVACGAGFDPLRHRALMQSAREARTTIPIEHLHQLERQLRAGTPSRRSRIRRARGPEVVEARPLRPGDKPYIRG